ncbi:MAG: aspartate carbamoyltransferase regulatory subunit [Hyphomicrobiales bacterium]
MENNKRKELIVSALNNGTVIDHLPSDSLFTVIRILGLDQSKNQIYFGSNLDSKKYGNKAIIKVKDRFFEPKELNKIALIAPSATLIEIKDYDVVNKQGVEIPGKVEQFVKCFNPNCVTNIEDEVKSRFKVDTSDGELKLHCHYCEKTTKSDSIEFL